METPTKTPSPAPSKKRVVESSEEDVLKTRHPSPKKLKFDEVIESAYRGSHSFYKHHYFICRNLLTIL